MVPSNTRYLSSHDILCVHGLLDVGWCLFGTNITVGGSGKVAIGVMRNNIVVLLLSNSGRHRGVPLILLVRVGTVLPPTGKEGNTPLCCPLKWGFPSFLLG